MTDWQPIETAPRDETPFLARQDDCVFAAFYKLNTAYNPKTDHILQVITRPGRYAAAGNWFRPTHWMPLPEPPSEER